MVESGTFQLQPHQKLISRYIAPHTPYKSCFLFQNTGTGKTVCAFSCVEGLRLFMDEHSTKALVLAPSNLILNEFINELLGKTIQLDGTIVYERRSSKDKYVDKELRDRLNSPDITEKERNKIEKYVLKYKIGKYYEFITHFKFVNILKSLSDDEIRKLFSNRVIVIDEIHKARNGKTLWNAIERLVRIAKNLRILFLSATSSFDALINFVS